MVVALRPDKAWPRVHRRVEGFSALEDPVLENRAAPFTRRGPVAVSADLRFPQPEVIKKVCLLGDASSQKSALIRPLVYHAMADNYITTIGTKVTAKSVEYNLPFGGGTLHIRLTFLIWDILGQMQYSRLHPVYYQGAEGGIIACSSDSPETIASVRTWAETFRDVVGDVPLVILLNDPNGGGPAKLDRAPLGALARDLHAALAVTGVETPERTEKAIVDLGEAMLRNYLDGVVIAPGLFKLFPRLAPKGRVGWIARRRQRRAEKMRGGDPKDGATAGDSQSKQS